MAYQHRSSYSEGQRALREVHAALKNGDDLSDEALLAKMDQYWVMSNTLDAASQLLEAIAPVCGYRNHLTEKLLPRIVYPLWMTEFTADDVIAWLAAHTRQENPNYKLESPGLEWVKNLVDQRDLIHKLLIEIQESENVSDSDDDL